MSVRSITTKSLLRAAIIIFAVLAGASFAEGIQTGSAPWMLAAIGAACALLATALVSRTLAAAEKAAPAEAAMRPAASAEGAPKAAAPGDVAVSAPSPRAAGDRKDDPAGTPHAAVQAAGRAEAQGASDASARSQDKHPAPAAASAAPASGAAASAGPADSAVAPSAEPETSVLDYEGLVKRLLATEDPIAELKLFVGDIRTRQAQASGDGKKLDGNGTVSALARLTVPDPADDEVEGEVLAPSGLEIFVARQLEEAGLFANDVELPRIKVVIPHLSQMLYLRTTEDMTYLAKLRVIKIEAALNAMRFACNYFEDRRAVTEEDCYRMLVELRTSICAQVQPMSEPMPLQDGDRPDGEWVVRRGISTAIESFTLPYRLTADFRTNVADGNVAIRLDLTPEQCFGSSEYVEGLGVVTSTRDMRHRAAADYALRLALIVANEAFRTSEKIKHVWIEGVIKTASRTRCYLCVDFDRWRFAKIDMQHVDDLGRIYRSFCPQMRYEGGILKPIRPTFSIEEERFCPSRRYVPVSLSRRKIPEPYAEALGTDHVSGLAIEEADKRTLIASDIARGIEGPDKADATEHNVKTIIDAAADDPDPTVRSAAERTVGKLIDGTLSDDALAVIDEFVEGDALSRSVRRAQGLMQQDEPGQAESLLAGVIDPLDKAGVYDDAGLVEYRYFVNYLDRALYNRLYAKGKSVLLVPDAYYEGLLLLVSARLAQHENDAALASARRAVAVAPLDMRAHLALVRCLEALDRADECVAELKHLLTIAHDPQTLGLAYYRLAFFEWHQGNILAAQACYQCSLHFMPGGMPQVSMELGVLAMQNPDTVKSDITTDEVIQILKDYDIPVAPTDQMFEAFYDATRASLDAEIFPVARNFVNALGSFTGDDVIFGIIRSIEGEPDR